uniref:Uncharacterized protein n=1 Tax=Rhizophora mucronata TaxID=61149 RepID=A0A2P2P2W1_RHIMU
MNEIGLKPEVSYYCLSYISHFTVCVYRISTVLQMWNMFAAGFFLLFGQYFMFYLR